MAKKKLVPDYKIDLSKDATTNGGTIANIYDSIKDSEKSFYSQLTRLKNKSENNSITLADVARGFIRKDVDDSVAGELSFSKSIKSDNYSQGDLGSGWKMSKDEFGRGTLDIDNINVRNELITKILTYDKIQSAGGTIILSAAWAELTRVEEVDENTINHKVICYYIPEGNFGQMWREEDIIKLQSGTNKYLMSYVESVSNTPDAETGEYSFTIYHGGIANQIGESIPAVGDTLVQFGCLDDDLPERQNIILMSVGDAANTFPYIEQYAQVNSLELSGKLITRISDEVYFGAGDQSKYLWWNQGGTGEFLLKGTLNQSPSGDKTPPPVWRGDYSSVTPYYAGDLVMYNGNTYIAKHNSTNKIGDPLYWTLYTSAGTGVESVTQQFHISTSKTVQPVEGSAGWVNIQPAWSVGLYLWNRIKIVYKDPPSTVYTGYSVSTEWEAINSIQVGGVNLMTRGLSSGVESTGFVSLLPVFNDDIYPYYLPAIWAMRYRFYNLPEGKYTFSVMVKAAVEDEFAQLRITELPTNAYIGWTTNEWTKLVHHFEISYSSPSPTPKLLQPYFVSDDALTLIKMANFQLESGTIATDYKLSPEDLQDNIENARQTELNMINGYILALGEDVEELQDQIDNVVVSWFGEYNPSESTEPQLSWLDYPTDEEKIQEQLNHINDTFTNTTEFIDITATPDAGKSWRFVKDNSVPPIFKWSRIQDTESAEALLKASEALDVADKKRQVFLSQPTYAQFYDEGDIWLNATASSGGFTYVNEMLRCKTPKVANSAFSLSHWVTATKYTDDALAQTAFNNAAIAKDEADDANNKLIAWADDSYISPTEKQSVKTLWNEIQIEKEKNVTQAGIYGSSTTNYTNAYNDLESYLNTYILIDFDTETAIIRNDFTSNFGLYYEERQELLNDISQKAKDFVGDSIANIEIGARNLVLESDTSVNTTAYLLRNYETAIPLNEGQEYTLTIDGDAGRVYDIFFNLGNTKAGTTISKSGGISILTFIAPALNVGEESKFKIYRASSYDHTYAKINWIKLERGKLSTDWSPAPEDLQAAADAALIEAQEANSMLAAWADDDNISPSEKQSVKAVWNEIQAEKPKIIAQAAIYDVDADDYIYAYQDVLYDYVVTQGLLANMTIASSIVRDHFEYAFSNYYIHRQNLLNAIAEAAKIFVGTSIDDIKIGGRNLILKSDFSNSLDGITAFVGTSKTLDAGDRCVLTNATGNPRAHFENLSLEGNTQYIFQVERWWDDIEQIVWRGSNYDYVSFTEIKRENISFEGGVRVFYKITLAGNDTGYIQVENTTALNEMRLRFPQLEKGTIPTDWTPAIEDSIGLISATKTVRYSKWKAGNYYFAGNVDDGGVGNNPLRYLDYVTNNRTDSAIGAYECKSYHLASIYNEPKTGTPPSQWQNTTYFPTIAGDVALFNEAVLGGFKFSPSYDSYGNLIPSVNQSFETSDGTPSTLPSIRLSGDGSGHLAKGALSWNTLGKLLFGKITSGRTLNISTDEIPTLAEILNKEVYTITPWHTNYEPWIPVGSTDFSPVIIETVSPTFILENDALLSISAEAWFYFGKDILEPGFDTTFSGIWLQRFNGTSWESLTKGTWYSGVDIDTPWWEFKLELINQSYSKGEYRLLYDTTGGWSSVPAGAYYRQITRDLYLSGSFKLKVKKLSVGIDGVSLQDSMSDKHLRMSLNDSGELLNAKGELKWVSENGQYGIHITNSQAMKCIGGVWSSL